MLKYLLLLAKLIASFQEHLVFKYLPPMNTDKMGENKCPPEFKRFIFIIFGYVSVSVSMRICA